MLCLMGELLSFVVGGARRAWLRRPAMVRRWESVSLEGSTIVTPFRRGFFSGDSLSWGCLRGQKGERSKWRDWRDLSGK